MNKQLGRDAIEIIGNMLAKQTTSDQYYITLLELDHKYPMAGHNPPLSKYQCVNYRKLGIQPKNFKEAGEIYAHHKQQVEIQSKPDFKKLSAGDLA